MKPSGRSSPKIHRGAVPTITQIAEKLGLSITTISYILNGKSKEMKIAEGTAQRVTAYAQKIGYQPNPLAQGLRMNKTKTVGIVFPDLRADWAQRILEGILPILDPLGYTALITVHFWNAKRERDEIASLLNRRVDALILSPQLENKDFYLQLQKGKTPTVILGDTFRDTPPLNYVAWNSAPAAERIVKHLIESGRRKIAFIGEPNALQQKHGHSRFAAYQKILRHFKIPLNKDHLLMLKAGVFSSEIFKDFLLQKNPPDAIFAMSDGIAIPTFSALLQLGLRIPADISLAGMGDLPPCQIPFIGITSAVEPCELMGAEAAKLAMSLIQTPKKQPRHTIIEKDELIIRRSTQRELKEPAQ